MSNAIDLNHSYRIPGYLKDKYNKLGKMSINDIINNIAWMSFGDKINYIRHNFTYYSGNEDLFYNSDKKTPNYRMSWLNRLIAAVVLKKYTPDVLKDFNNIILKWRRERENSKKVVTDLVKTESVKQEICNESKNISNKKFEKWLRTTFVWNAVPYNLYSSNFINLCKRITFLRLYLNSFDNIFDLNNISNLDIKTMLKYSDSWSQEPNKLNDYDFDKEYNITKNLLLELTRKRKLKKEAVMTKKYEEYIENKYAEQKLREYDQYLKAKKGQNNDAVTD